MTILIVTPIPEELAFLSDSLKHEGFHSENSVLGRLPVVHFHEPGITLAQGGLGKVQFAIQVQHLLDACSDWDAVICAGAAGGLSDQVSAGDIVVATTTIEHDFITKFAPRPCPRFDAASDILVHLQHAALVPQSFKVHFGVISSGDEDIVESARKQTLQASYQALAVAWEGAGGARACAFSHVPFVEIRGVTDGANEMAVSDFDSNLEWVMHNIATFILSWIN